MAIEHALSALREYWDDVLSRLERLGPDKAGRLRALVEALRGPDQESAATDIADFLVDNLPAEHPVRRALSVGYLSQTATIDWAALELDLLEKSEDSPRPSDWILRSVLYRLLGAPALTEQEVKRRGADPADPALIRLDRADGDSQWPAFQFEANPDGGPLPVVRAVNRLLGAAADPVGVADWWLSKNGWLNDEPRRLIGKVPDDLLMRAARAIGSEV